MTMIAVDCIIRPDGSVRVRRVQIDKRWQTVAQGRQWLDQYGRHVLIMLSGDEVREIVLRPDTMTWDLVESRSDKRIV